jgi:quinol monooxygenase YgiN
MVGLEIVIRIYPQKRREFLQAAELFSEAGKEKEGRMSCHVYEDIATPNRFFWVDRWRDGKSMAEHFKSGYFKALMGAIEVLGELESRQEIRVKEVPG